MTKIYELAGKDRCQINLTYFGVKLNVEFRGTGGGISHSQFKTNDRFLQDALEHDFRFNRLYKLMQTFDENDSPAKPAAEKEEQAPRRAKNITSVKSLNQALNYFVRIGETPQTDEDVKQLMEKYNIAFPNWKEDEL